MKVARAVNALVASPLTPGQEGWTRHQENVAKPPLMERTWWLFKLKPDQPPRLRHQRRLRAFFLLAQPPLLDRRGEGLLLLLVGLLSSSLLLAQDQPQQPFTINVSTQLVIQTVTVTDKDGKPIEGLKAEDFVLTEDNVSQTISVFEFEKLDDTQLPQQPPTLAADKGPAQPPIQNRIAPVPPGESRYQDRRLLALYFDMPALGDAERFRALDAAQDFIQKQMTAADLVAIMTYSDGAVRVRQDFTDNRAALHETIFALLNGEDLDDTGTDFGQNAGEFNIFNTDRQLAALQTAVNMLGVLKEKKSLIDFTSGMNLSGVDNQAQLRATLNAARRANVSFYPIDARGLVAMAPMGDASRPSPGGIGMYKIGSASCSE